MRALTRLASGLAVKLKAVPHPHPPARATFDGGAIFLGENEVAIMFDEVGAFFVSILDGLIVIEAAAFNDGEPRSVVCARHDELDRWSRELFGSELERRDPLGLRGGEPAVMS